MKQNAAVNNPKAFYLLSTVEMWERFGYYGMQGLLVIFMVQHLQMADAVAENTFSAFTALVYAFVVIGGYVGDKLLGLKRTMLLGALVLASGYLLLGVNSDRFLYPALGIIVAGNALFKANPSALLSKLYPPNDSRLDGAFTLYYMAINIGSFLSMLISPYVESRFGWGWAFILSFVGLIVAIANYIFFHGIVADYGSEADFRPLNRLNFAGVVGVTALIAVVSAWLLKHLVIAHGLLCTAIFVVLCLFVREMIHSTQAERVKLSVCLVLIVEAIFFFILYQQMPTSLNLFAIRNVSHTVLAISIEPATFQALNPLWIMFASPILSYIYICLGRKNRDFSLPAKFAFGMFLCALGFLVLPFAAKYYSSEHGLISGNWLIVTYGFQSVGELLVSGLGLAMVARLVPERSVGFMMGAWFMSMALAGILGGYVATVASISESIVDPLQSLPVYSALFLRIGLVALLVSFFMFLAVPKLKKYTES